MDPDLTNAFFDSINEQRDALSVGNSTQRGFLDLLLVSLLYLLCTTVTFPHLSAVGNTTRIMVSALPSMNVDKGPEALARSTGSLLLDLAFPFMAQEPLHAGAVGRRASLILALGCVRKKKQVKLHTACPLLLKLPPLLNSVSNIRCHGGCVKCGFCIF